ncbi:MAG: MEMO1 family protein [Candidatus Micrarchaeales archaeon]
MREPVVAGAFYPANAEMLREMVSGLIGKVEIDEKAISNSCAFVAPHAGYAYSGQVAAYTYAALRSACRKNAIDSLIVIGPNHTGYGEPIAISLEDWKTPLGTVKNDIELSKALAESSTVISTDETAHAREHSIEVQLPFIQKSVGNIKCVFICMGDQSYNASMMLAEAITKTCDAMKRNSAVVASSDFNHYESANIAREKDMPAIDALKLLDTVKFNDMLHRNKDTACGYGPITVAAMFAKNRGAKKGVLLEYSNSGSTTRDYGSVVAYASIVFI